MATSTKKAGNVVQIAAAGEDKKLSAAQKQFNSLSKRIDKQKKRLREWRQTVPVYRQKVQREYQPLLDSFNQQRLELARLFDRYHDNPSFKKPDKKKISFMINGLCEQLMGADDDEVKALFNKYNEEDYDALVQEQDQAIGEMMKGVAKQMFGVDLDEDVDVSSPEKFHQQIQEKLRLQAEQQTAFEPSARPRKQTKKQLEREARLQEEAALASKSVQEVYRKLVAVLHPDREPDEQERRRKTELMQQVNTAYQKKDLLQLLELQLQVEQIDVAQLSQMADSRLKYFNQILKEQLAELDQEIFTIEDGFKIQFDLPFGRALPPASLLKFLAEDISQLKRQSEMIKQDLTLFADAAGFKAWLKTFKIPRKSSKPSPFDFDDDMFIEW